MQLPMWNIDDNRFMETLQLDWRVWCLNVKKMHGKGDIFTSIWSQFGPHHWQAERMDMLKRGIRWATPAVEPAEKWLSPIYAKLKWFYLLSDGDKFQICIAPI